MPIEFPAPRDDDSEDVAWQLTTGAALWKRGERYDAIVWLKRAVVESSRAGAAGRADQLNHVTTELMAQLATPSLRSESTPAPAKARARPPIPPLRNKVTLSPPVAKDQSSPDSLAPAPAIEPFVDPLAENAESGRVRAPLLGAPRDELPSVTTSAPPLAALTQRSAGAERVRPLSRPPPPTIVPDVATAKIPAIAPVPLANALAAQDHEPGAEPNGPARQLARVLGGVAQLSPEQREGLARTAKIATLAAGEDMKVAGLTIVIDGEATVGPEITDVAAVRIATGEPLLAQCSIADALPLRLVAEANPTGIATWERAEAEHWLALTPDLLAQWRHASDRVQAMSGSTIGAVGEKLDDGLRAMLFERLEVRALAPGAVVAHAGSAVPGITIVGIGHLELERDGRALPKLGPGEFLFGAEVLAQTPAPATARAGAKGAVVLTGSRSTTYDLLMSCPPLLEIFAGM